MARRRAVAVLLGVYAVAAFASRWVRIIQEPFGDFTLHWLFGQRFLDRTFLYENGMHIPYPPFWGMASSLLNVGPMATVRAILYPFGLVPLAVLLVVLQRLTRRALPLEGRRAELWTVAIGLLLASRFVIRELPECGANLMIVALTWVGIYLWMRRREGWGGLSLGAAIALKCTPAIFLAYFAWKRQWKMLATSTVAAGLLTLAPALWMGPVSYVWHIEHWVRNAQRGIAEPHPVRGVLGDDTVYNLSMRPGLGRLLVDLPPDHEGAFRHPLRVQPASLPPVVASWMVKAIMGALVLGLFWGFGTRARTGAPREDIAVAWECAAVSVLGLLLSPITWRQHCVALVPAMYLIARTCFAERAIPRGIRTPMAFYVVFTLVLDRGVIGKDLTLLLDSYSISMWCFLAVLLAVMRERGRCLAGGAAGGPNEEASGTTTTPTAVRAA
jgi:hypothetical protein